MTRTEELLALTNNPLNEETSIFIYGSVLKQLIKLVRLQHEALEWAAEIDAAFDGVASSKLTKAIAAFNKFEGGE